MEQEIDVMGEIDSFFLNLTEEDFKRTLDLAKYDLYIGVTDVLLDDSFPMEK